jgi:oligosaccharide repeat unit polymerase
MIAVIGLSNLIYNSGLMQIGTEYIWLFVLTVFCLGKFFYSFAIKNFDIFEPIYPIAIATLIYYGLIVFILMQEDAFYLDGIDYRNEIPKVVFMSLVAFIGYFLGYIAGRENFLRIRKKPEIQDNERYFLNRTGWFLLGFFIIVFSLWILIAKIPIWSLWIFDEAYYNQWKLEALGPNIGHLFASIETFPACFLIIISTRSSKRFPIFLITIILFTTVLYMTIGVRARLVILFGSMAALYYLEKDKRPSLLACFVFSIISFIFIIGLIGHFRGPEKSEYYLLEAWTHFVQGADIATTTAMYIQLVPEYGYTFGVKFLNIFLSSIPNFIWPEKYLFFNVYPIDDMRSVGAAAAFFVVLYESFGLSGVVSGMAIIGFICRIIYNSYRANSNNPLAQIALALTWAFLFHGYGRDSTVIVLVSLLFTFAPLWVSSLLLQLQRVHILKRI